MYWNKDQTEFYKQKREELAKQMEEGKRLDEEIRKNLGGMWYGAL